MSEELIDIKQLLTSQLQVDAVALKKIITLEELVAWLSQYVDQLISNDFDALLLLLYRIDVSEKKVKALLAKDNGLNSAQIIAELIIKRQQQKIYWRSQFKSSHTEIDESERW
ncbi:MAG TPA: hypothetical protein VLZ75_06465 [Chitinophagales bacterium]|nr:hypothetical protein [Chitinophagales bacterium]